MHGTDVPHGGRASFARAALLLTLMLLLALPAAGWCARYGSASNWQGPSWWFRLRSTGYSYQTVGAGDAELDHFGAYQNYDGSVKGLWGGKLAFRAAGRFADDLVLEPRVNTRERLYVGYGQLDLQPMHTQARLGRQFLHEGASSLTLDGLWVSMHPLRRLELRAWGGARSPYSKIYEPGSVGDDGAVGVRVIGQTSRRVRLSASWAYRENGGYEAAQPVGMEAMVLPRRGMRAIGRVAYDTTREMWQRAEFLGQWRPMPRLPILTLQFLDRKPAIDADSYFARFGDLERVRVGRASVRYVDRKGYGAEVEYFGGFVGARTSTRIGGSVLAPFGQIGYSARLGDSGEESSWYGNVRYAPLSWVSLEAGGMISTYALLQDAPESLDRDLTTAYGRVRTTLRQGVEMLAELQRVTNPDYTEDVRVLLGLDFTMGRGASGFGLGRGGWFQ